MGLLYQPMNELVLTGVFKLFSSLGPQIDGEIEEGASATSMQKHH